MRISVDAPTPELAPLPGYLRVFLDDVLLEGCVLMADEEAGEIECALYDTGGNMVMREPHSEGPVRQRVQGRVRLALCSSAPPAVQQAYADIRAAEATAT